MGYEGYRIKRENVKKQIKNEYQDFDYENANNQKNALNSILNKLGFKLSKSNLSNIEKKKEDINYINESMNDAYESMYKAESEVEKEYPDFSNLDRTIKAIISFAGEPKDLNKNVKTFLTGTNLQKEEIFKKSFNRALELKNKIDEAESTKEIAEIYKQNPFGFNALAEFDKGPVLIDSFNLKDKKLLDNLKENSKAMTESSLKEKVIEVESNPYNLFFSIDDSQIFAEAQTVEDNDDLVDFIVENNEIKDYMATLSGASTIKKDGMEIQANGMLGQRNKDGKFQGFYNDVQNIDKGFKEKDIKDISKDNLKNKLDNLYDNLKKNNSFTMRWHSKSNYSDIMKKLDSVRKLDSKEEMLKGLKDIVNESEKYLDTKAKDKKTKNSVLRENAIFKLKEFCNGVVKTNQLEKEVKEKAKESRVQIKISSKEFENNLSNKKQYNVSKDDLSKVRSNLKSTKKNKQEAVKEDQEFHL